MILRKDEKLLELEQGKYSIRLTVHSSPVWPLVEADELEERMRQLGYYGDNGAKGDIEIEGPFRNLNIEDSKE